MLLNSHNYQKILFDFFRTFTRLWQQVGANLPHYKTFPRLAGECGGKNYHFVHPSADAER